MFKVIRSAVDVVTGNAGFRLQILVLFTIAGFLWLDIRLWKRENRVYWIHLVCCNLLEEELVWRT